MGRLILYFSLDIKLIKDSLHTGKSGPVQYKYRGGLYTAKYIEDTKRYTDIFHPNASKWSAFGNETLLGINGLEMKVEEEKFYQRSLLLQTNGDHVILKDISRIVVAGNGYVASISKGNLSLVVLQMY